MAKYVNLDDCEVVYCGSDGDYEKYNIPYDMPTADVVEVVRCKDCEYYQRDLMWGHGYCYGQKRKEDWFCADGRRRDDGNN